MLAFPEMMLAPAGEAGIKTPEDVESYDPQDYPHFKVLCNFQLGRPMPSPTSHWENAKIIAAIPEDKIKTIYMDELIKLGCS